MDSLEAVDRLESLPKTGKRTPNLGERMLARVREFVASGAVAEATALRNSPRNLALEELTRIHGVGAATAQAWFHDHWETTETTSTSKLKFDDAPDIVFGGKISY